jgi:hypothetical protein
MLDPPEIAIDNYPYRLLIIEHLFVFGKGKLEIDGENLTYVTGRADEGRPASGSWIVIVRAWSRSPYPLLLG